MPTTSKPSYLGVRRNSHTHKQGVGRNALREEVGEDPTYREQPCGERAKDRGYPAAFTTSPHRIDAPVENIASQINCRSNG